MTNVKFAKAIYKRQNAIVRELNDAHIFLEQITPLLIGAKEKYLVSKVKKDKRYYVPSIKKSKIARRTDAELKNIYDKYLNVGLFESFLVSFIAKFEGFLSDVTNEFFKHHPMRMTTSFKNIPPCEKAEIKLILSVEGKDDLVGRLRSSYVGNIFRQRPSVYMDYLSTLLDVKKDNVMADYYEICATRDLIIHNGSVVNDIYLEKSGKKARAKRGEIVGVDEEYFGGCIAKLKRLSGLIKGSVETKFGTEKSGSS